MAILESTISPSSAAYKANRDGMLALISRLRMLEERTRAASAAAKDRFHKRGQLLPILLRLKVPEAHWQVTAIGRAEMWPLHQRCADLGGHLRTGLEDTFYLGDGTKVTSNGQLIEAIAACARRAGREIASPAEARQIFGTRHLSRHSGAREA